MSVSVLHRGPTDYHQSEVPYRYAIVRLSEGPKMVTQVLGRASEALQMGDAVRAVFVEFEERSKRYVAFCPVDSIDDVGTSVEFSAGDDGPE